MKTKITLLTITLAFMGLSNVTNAQTIAAGGNHSFAVCSDDNTGRSWGYNNVGQLGYGNNTNSNTSKQISSLTGITAIAGGLQHALALKSDGTVVAWGYNGNTQLGNGGTSNSNVPVPVGGSLTSITAVSGGDRHSMALKSNGTVWVWGYNGNGQIGNGTAPNANTFAPAQASSITGITAIAAGGEHCVALKSDGTVWAWGDNASYQLANYNGTTDSNVPSQVSGVQYTTTYLSGITAIAAGNRHSLGLKSDGTVVAWGYNGDAQLGTGNYTSYSNPKQVSSLTGIIAIAGGNNYSLALKNDGTVWAWGNNAQGQLGNGTNTASTVPVQVSFLTGITAIAGGGLHCLAKKNDGTIWAWGYNGYGQLGNGTFGNSNIPLQVNGPCYIVQEPTLASSNIQFTTVSTNSLSLIWNSGNGSKHFVVAKAASAVNQQPVDVRPYVANASFGSGTDMGGSNYVVYAGAGNAVTVTNLTPDVIYHFAIYEFNDSTVSAYENYLITSYATASHTTMALEPTAATNQISFSNSNYTSITVTLTPGNGTKRIVVAKQGSAVNSAPVDTFAYVANSIFGTANTMMDTGNYVVYNGIGNSFTVTGLTLNTTYHFVSYEYNGATAAANNYITNTPAVGSQSTLKTEPTTSSTNIQFTAVSTNSLSLTWNIGNGSKHLVIGKALSVVNQSPTDGTSYTANNSFGTGSVLGTGNYVVYAGTGNTVTVTNLTPDLIYHFAIYEFNDSTVSAYENYLTANSATSSHTTLALEPTAATNQISFSNSNYTSMTVTVTPGNGSKRIVVAKQGSAVNVLPVDTFAYAANSIFGTSNTNMGNGNYVVYNGTGNTFTLTGLALNTTYHFASYEYNGATAAANNYITSTPAVGSQSTLKTEPTTSSTNIQFIAVSTNSLSLTWYNGNGSKHLVVGKAVSAVNQSPIDGTSYTANNSFGTGSVLGTGNYVVYAGTGNAVTVTNLTPNVIYHFKIYDYNDSTVAGYENYLTTSFATANHTTIALEPTIATGNFSFLNVSLDSMTVNVTPGNGSHRVIIAKQSSFVNNTALEDTMAYSANSVFGIGMAQGTGNYIVYNGTGTSFNLSGLTPNIPYYFASYEYNMGNITAANNYLLTTPATGMQGSLNSEPTLQPTAITFTNITDNSMSLSWINGDGINRIVIARTSTVNAAPEDGLEYTANSIFASGDDLGLNNYIVYSGTSNTFNLSGLTANTTYYFAIYEYNGTNTSNNYLMPAPATAFKSTLFLEPVTPASNLTLSPITNGITTVNWTNGSGSNRVVVVREGLPINELPDDGNGYTANSTFTSGTDLGSANYICFDGNTNSFNLQGLNPANVYYVGVIEYNGSGTSANYLTSSFPIANNLPASPTIGPSALNITANSNSSALVSWTNGNGQYRLLIVKANSPVDETPLDGSIYAANASFSSGAQLGTGNYTVYNGTANNTIVTNLDSNITYYFALFEFNKDGAGPANYLETPSLTGNYNLITGLGIDEITEQFSFVVYPNPTTGIFSIKHQNNHQQMNVEVYNMLGEKVLQQQNTNEINLSASPKGVYFVRIYDDTKSYTTKINVQ